MEMTVMAQRQLATLLAALRPLQKNHGALTREILRLATDDDALETRTRAEIGEFCERPAVKT
jgi:hypothetical protein